MQLLETRNDPLFRAVPDLHGGMWLRTSYGILHRPGRSPGGESGVLAPFGEGHLAVDPTTGDLIYDGPDGLTRVARVGGAASIAAPYQDYVFALDVGADGTIWFSDSRGLQRVTPGGEPEEIDADPDGATAIVATPEGIVYFRNGGVFRWTESGGSVLIAGINGAYCFPPDPCGDGGPALDARFNEVNQLDVTVDGTILLGELHGRVRAIAGDGTVRKVLGAWERCYLARIDCGVGGGARGALLDNVMSMAVDGSTLYVVDQSGASSSSRLLSVQPWTTDPTPPQGYRMIASDGGVFTFGWGAFKGSTGDVRLASPIVAGRSNGVNGYWFVAGDGGVFTFGDAQFFGSAAGRTTSPVVDMAASTHFDGYWVAERDGRVHRFGDIPDPIRPPDPPPYAALIGRGSSVQLVAERPSSLPRLNVPIVAAHSTSSGNGAWYVASDGGVFTEGNAGFFGSTGAMRLNQPVLDLIPTPSEQGYWLIAADGGVFTFGDARFMGSMGAVRLNRPVVAGVAGPVPSG